MTFDPVSESWEKGKVDATVCYSGNDKRKLRHTKWRTELKSARQDVVHNTFFKNCLMYFQLVV